MARLTFGSVVNVVGSLPWSDYRQLSVQQERQSPGSAHGLHPAVPQRVSAWIVWEDGVEGLVPAEAIAWTRRAVRVRFGAPPHQRNVWVWAGAVERDG